VRAGQPGPTPAFTGDPSARRDAPHRFLPPSGARREGIVVYVAGDVRRGGIYTLPPGARAVDALRAAGGAGHGADLVDVNLAQELSDGDEVAVPALADAAEPTGTRHRHTSHHTKHRKHGRKRHRHRRSTTVLAASDAGTDASTDPSSGAAGSDAPAAVIDLNTADESELETLPGVGATLAGRIVSFRELTGSFASADDLLDVAGITQSKLDAIEPYVTTGAAPSEAPSEAP